MPSPETDNQNPKRKTQSIPAVSTSEYPSFPSLPPFLSAHRGTITCKKGETMSILVIVYSTLNFDGTVYIRAASFTSKVIARSVCKYKVNKRMAFVPRIGVLFL